MFGFFSGKASLQDTELLKGFTDNHSHILYGVDDGVRTKEEALSVLSFMEKEGVKKVWCTPHFMEDVRNTTEDIRTRFGQLKSEWTGGVELELASENMLDNLFKERWKTGDFLFHGDGRLLVETSTWAPPMDFWDIMDSIVVAGYTPIIAHPERYRYMKMEDYRRMADMGVEFQLNLPSILGVYGDETAKKAEAILEKGWYTMAGTDCHRFRALESQVSCKILSKGTVARLRSLLSR